MLSSLNLSSLKWFTLMPCCRLSTILKSPVLYVDDRFLVNFSNEVIRRQGLHGDANELSRDTDDPCLASRTLGAMNQIATAQLNWKKSVDNL